MLFYPMYAIAPAQRGFPHFWCHGRNSKRPLPERPRKRAEQGETGRERISARKKTGSG